MPPYHLLIYYLLVIKLVGLKGDKGDDGVDGKDGAVCSVVDTEASGVTGDGGQQNTSTESVDMGTFTGSVDDLTVNVDVSGATVDVTIQGGSAAPIQVQTDVRQPYLTVKYCVALVGTFPSRN